MENSLLRVVGTTLFHKVNVKQIQCNVTNRWRTDARNYSANEEPQTTERKNIHPYKNIHPWKSLDQFSKELVKNVIYNKDGLVVLNKPYGISSKPPTIAKKDPKWESINSIPNAVDYTLADVIPSVAKELGHSSLVLVKAPEKFISGITLLATDEKKRDAVNKSLARAPPAQILPRTYWVITSKIPRNKNGSERLAITLQDSPCRTVKQPVILNEWTKKSIKRSEAKPLNIDYRVLSNSTQNLCSLVEMKCSTTKWHAIRVYASTMLYSPILGDNIHGSRIQEVMGTHLNISPFVDAARRPQKLKKELLKKLDLSPGQDVLVPTHIHLKEMQLISFLGRGSDLTLDAPLPASFLWTCERLHFQIVIENDEFPPREYVSAA